MKAEREYNYDAWHLCLSSIIQLHHHTPETASIPFWRLVDSRLLAVGDVRRIPLASTTRHSSKRNLTGCKQPDSLDLMCRDEPYISCIVQEPPRVKPPGLRSSEPSVSVGRGHRTERPRRLSLDPVATLRRARYLNCACGTGSRR